MEAIPVTGDVTFTCRNLENCVSPFACEAFPGPRHKDKGVQGSEHREQLVGDRATSVSPVPASCKAQAVLAWGWLDLLKFCTWRLQCCVEAAVAHSRVCAMFWLPLCCCCSRGTWKINLAPAASSRTSFSQVKSLQQRGQLWAHPSSRRQKGRTHSSVLSPVSTGGSGLQTGALCLKRDRMNPGVRLCLCLISGDGRTGLELPWL